MQVYLRMEGGRLSSVIFGLSIVSELGLVSFCTLWPIRDELRYAESLQQLLDLYSIDSNLDVWVQSVLHCLVLPLCFLRVAGLNRRHRRRYASARLAISCIAYFCQVIDLEDWIPGLNANLDLIWTVILWVEYKPYHLPGALQLLCLAKAVLVAVLGKEILWPGRHGDVGLIYMYGAICISLIALLAQLLSATALVTGEHCFSARAQLLALSTNVFKYEEMLLSASLACCSIDLLFY